MTAGFGWSTLSRRLGLPRTLPVLVLAAGVMLSAAAGLQVDRVVRAKDAERFANSVQQTQDAIAGRFNTYVAILQAGAGLFAAQDGEVTTSGFRAFADRLDLPHRFPGAQGIGYARRVTPQEAPAAVAAMRRDGVEGLTLKADAAADQFPIAILEPQDRRNRAAMGFDMYSDPVRRAAMSTARDTGRTVTSGKVQLRQEIDSYKQAGFLIYQPVYRGGAVPPTVDDRRERLAGFVYSPFRADDLLNGIFRAQEQPRVLLAVYDGAARPENLLHRSFREAPETMAQTARLSTTRTLDVAGRPWTIVYYTRPEMDLGSSRLAPAFFIGGLIATVLVAAATWSQVSARLAAEGEISARQEVEAQRKLLLDELNHRVKNTLATVQSIARQTLREGRPLLAARETFQSRLIALSQTHDLLTRDHWRGAGLADLVEMELAPYSGATPGRVVAEGPDVSLSPAIALALGMALHELATNAAKYGALSLPEGRVETHWEVADGRLRLTWREVGGPPVATPMHEGFGTRLITSGLKRQLRGEVQILYLPDGLRCTIDIPLRDPDGRRAAV